MLFPVQRVAEIMPTRAANFFFSFLFFCKKITELCIEKKKKNRKFGTNIITRPLQKKQTFFKGGLSNAYWHTCDIYHDAQVSTRTIINIRSTTKCS